MTDVLPSNLTFHCQSMGDIVIQPTKMPKDELNRVSLVAFPERLDSQGRAVLVEWASATQAPIFCLAADAESMVDEGFGPYRFHKIDGFREVDFQGGALEFYPARRQKPDGIRGAVFEIAEKLGFYAPHSFHVVVRPKVGSAFLYLSTPQIDRVEWQLLMNSKPEFVVGSARVSQEAWAEFSERTHQSVLSAAQHSDIGRIPSESFAPTQKVKQWPSGGARNTLSS
jgi:hypothetical protein